MTPDKGVWNWCDPDGRAIEKVVGDRTSEDTAPLATLIAIASKYKRVLVLGDSDQDDGVTGLGRLKTPDYNRRVGGFLFQRMIWG